VHYRRQGGHGHDDQAPEPISSTVAEEIQAQGTARTRDGFRLELSARGTADALKGLLKKSGQPSPKLVEQLVVSMHRTIDRGIRDDLADPGQRGDGVSGHANTTAQGVRMFVRVEHDDGQRLSSEKLGTLLRIALSGAAVKTSLSTLR
jgi:hypothetical protein